MNIYGTIPLISCIAYGVLILITLNSRRTRVRYTFLIYLGVALAWSFSSFMLHANFFPQHTMKWYTALMIALFSTWIIYYNFVRSFTNQKSMGAVVPIGYGAIALFALFASLGYVIEDAYVADGLLYYKLAPSMYIFVMPVAIVFFGLAIFLLVRHYRSTSSYIERNRIVYLLVGFSFMVLFLFTNLSSSLSRYPIDHIGNFINACFITYTIVKYQLMDIRVIIRRGLVYSVLTICLTATYLVLLFSLYSYFHSWASASFGTAAGLALLFAIMFQPLRNVIQRWVDRLFYRGTYDYRQTLLTFSKRMSNVLNLDELAENMLYPITKALYSKQAYLLLTEAEGSDFVTWSVQPSATKKPTATMRLRGDNPIVAWLGKEGKVLNREQIDIRPEFKSLWETEREELDALELELFCPIRRKGNLIGILALSRKQSDAPYSSEDIDLLTTMTNEAAMVMENAIILNNLKEQQLRVEQLLTRTVLAQEEERKRISIELHDSVAQWLVSASYRMQACRALLSETNNNEAQGELVEIEATIDKSLKELRQVMTGLHPPSLDELGLVPALQRALEGLKANGIAYHLDTAGEPVRLHPSTELAIYRVVQEALTNVRKHSGASAVVIRLQFQPENISVEVSDNGKGFNLPQTMRSAVPVGHMGLLGMRERATMLGGTLKIKTRPGAGTSICLMLPTVPSAAASLETDGNNV